MIFICLQHSAAWINLLRCLHECLAEIRTFLNDDTPLPALWIKTSIPPSTVENDNQSIPKEITSAAIEREETTRDACHLVHGDYVLNTSCSDNSGMDCKIEPGEGDKEPPCDSHQSLKEEEDLEDLSHKLENEKANDGCNAVYDSNDDAGNNLFADQAKHHHANLEEHKESMRYHPADSDVEHTTLSTQNIYDNSVNATKIRDVNMAASPPNEVQVLLLDSKMDCNFAENAQSNNSSYKTSMDSNSNRSNEEIHHTHGERQPHAVESINLDTSSLADVQADGDITEPFSTSSLDDNVQAVITPVSILDGSNTTGGKIANQPNSRNHTLIKCTEISNRHKNLKNTNNLISDNTSSADKKFVISLE